LASDEIVEGTNNTVGAVRLLTLKGGGTIKEKLLAYDDAGHSFKYSILEGAVPFSHYTSTFIVKSLGFGDLVGSLQAQRPQRSAWRKGK